jgi:hypothetical protein
VRSKPVAGRSVACITVVFMGKILGGSGDAGVQRISSF